MEIYVKTIPGKTITVEIESRNTVSDLKDKIQDKEGFHPDQQRLVFDGKQLVNDMVLDQINLIQGSTIWLVLRMRGGANVVYHRPLWSDELPQNGETKKSLAFKLSGGEMQVHIMDVTGRQIPVEIAISDTISGIKQKIFDKESIDPYDQLFVFGGWHFIEGVVLDQINASLARQPQLSDSGESGPMPRRWWYYFDDLTGTVHATIMMILQLEGGGNAINNAAKKTNSSSTRSDSDCIDEQHLGDGGNILSHKVKVRSISSVPESSNLDDHPQNGKKRKNSG